MNSLPYPIRIVGKYKSGKTMLLIALLMKAYKEWKRPLLICDKYFANFFKKRKGEEFSFMERVLKANDIALRGSDINTAYVHHRLSDEDFFDFCIRE